MRDWQVALLQRLRRRDIGPAEATPVGDHERLDRKSATRDLDRAVLADQAALLAAVGADQRPIGLLAGEAAREAAAGRDPGEAFDEGVGGGGPSERLDLHLGQRRRRSIARQPYAQVVRLGVGQRKGIVAAVAVRDSAQRAPAATVV